MLTKVLMRSIAAVALILGVTTAAPAAVINIPAVTFVPRDLNSSTSSDPGEVIQGLLGNANGKYYAPVIFPSGGNVCAVHLVFRDFDADFNVTARLVRKAYAIGGNSFTPPNIMSALISVGSNANTQRITDNTIFAPLVNLLNSFYYVELVLPAATLEVFGVQIDFRTTACP